MLLSSSNRKYPPVPLLSYFSVVVCLRCLLHHILSLISYTFRQTGNLFSLLLCSLWWVQIVGYVLHCRSYTFVCTPSHYHHCAKSSEDIELIKCLSDIFCRVCVSKIKHTLSVIHYTIHYTICGAVCFQFIHSSCDDWENIYIVCLVIIINSEVWTITHCLGLGHKTMVCAVCLSIFLWIYSYGIYDSNQGTTPNWSYNQIEYNGDEIIAIMKNNWLNLTVTLQITSQNR